MVCASPRRSGEQVGPLHEHQLGPKSLAVDLKIGEGRRVLLDLVRRADVVVENFRPGTLERLGTGEVESTECNPSVIFASISGFGQSAPDAQRPAYDTVVQARSDLMSVTGTEDGTCVKVGASISDIVTGLYAALGIAALPVAGVVYAGDPASQGGAQGG